MTIPAPDQLPPAAYADLVSEVVPTKALASPEAWRAWLDGPTGETAWVDGQAVPETRFMARAGTGTVAGGYVKSAATHLGMTVWERVN
jgi:hypothetical protein